MTKNKPTGLVSFVALLVVAVTFYASGLSQETQKMKITGRVLDDSTQTPIANANVFIANSMIGTSSDTSGRFALRGIAPGFYELVASCVGYSMHSIKILVLQTDDLKVDFRLTPKLLRLSVVEVTVAQPVEWKENLKTFMKLLLGATPEASACRITNPEVIDFVAASSGRFSARSDKEITIDNLALGYQLHLNLLKVDFDGRWLSSQYKVRYEEIVPLEPAILSKWQTKRADVYSGSLRHFFVSLINNDLDGDGFTHYNPEKLYQVSGTSPLPELKRRDLLRQSDPNEWVVRFHNLLVVLYDRREFDMEPGQMYYREYGRLSGNPRRGLRRPQLSILTLTKDSVVVDGGGQILDQLALRVSGDWGKDGLAKQLPLEFRPGSNK